MNDYTTRVEQWRSWSQFVFLGGGPVPEDDTDEDVQRKLCEAVSREEIAQRQKIAELEGQIQGLQTAHEQEKR